MKAAGGARIWGAGILLAAVVACSLCAPLYARIAGVDAFASNVAGTVERAGHEIDIMQPDDNPLRLGLTPIGPDWHFSEWRLGAYVLGADSQGRDVLARVLYGGRASLLIAFGAALSCLAVSALAALCAGYFGGWVDALLSRLLDVLWAVPVYLLAISLSVVTLARPLRLGPFSLGADSLVTPIVIVALVYVPYAVRPLRARVLTLARAEFVTAARGTGASHARILAREILPNLLPALAVLAPLIAALCLLAESSLSFLSLGVQAPAASWGTIIQDGEGLLYTRPAVAIAPGIAIVLTVLALNVLAGALRDRTAPGRRQERRP